MAALEKKPACELDVSELLPDGPLQQIVSLVQDPHRKHARLVCRRFCAAEAHTRTSLSFRVPRPRESTQRSASSSPSVARQFSRNKGFLPSATPDSESENEVDTAFLRRPFQNSGALQSEAAHEERNEAAKSVGQRPSATTSHRSSLAVASPSSPPLEELDDFLVDERHPNLMKSRIGPSCSQGPFSQTQAQQPSTGRGGQGPGSEEEAGVPSCTPAPREAKHLLNRASMADEPANSAVAMASASEDPAFRRMTPASSEEVGTANDDVVSDTESSQVFPPRPQRDFAACLVTASDGDRSEDDMSLNQDQQKYKKVFRDAERLKRDRCDDGSPASLRNQKPPMQHEGVVEKNIASFADVPWDDSPKQISSDAPTLLAQSLTSVPHSSSPRIALSPSTAPLSLDGDQSCPETVHFSPEVRLTRLLQRFTQVKCLSICDLHPGSTGRGRSSPLDVQLLSAVSRHAPMLEELQLSGQSLGWMVDDDGLAKVAEGCPRLRKLVVHHWVVGRQGMAALADAGCLQELEMDFFARDQAAGPHQTVAEIARCHSLTSLHLRYLNNEDIRMLAQGCPSLKRLTVLFSVLGPSFATLGQRCTDLQELTLRSCDTNPGDDPLASLALHCTSLRTLCLHAGHADSENGLCSLVAGCPHLTKLSIEFKTFPVRLVGIAEHLKGLKELTLQWIQASDEDLVALSRHCKSLTILILSLLQNVTDAGICTLLEGCGASLEVLLLRVREASDSVLPTLGSCCPKLQRLTLGLPRMTSSGLVSMLDSRPEQRRLQLLRRLRLWDCSSLSEDALDHIQEFCPELEGLGVKGCPGLSATKLQELVLRSGSLAHLEVEGQLLPFLQPVAERKGIDIVEAAP